MATLYSVRFSTFLFHGLAKSAYKMSVSRCLLNTRFPGFGKIQQKVGKGGKYVPLSCSVNDALRLNLHLAVVKETENCDSLISVLLIIEGPQ